MEKQYCDILIKNTRILNDNMEVESDKNIIIIDGKIRSITNNVDDYSGDTVIDGRDNLWMPGLTDGHMHTCQQLLRGKILDELPMIWTRIMVPFESSLTSESVDLSAKLSSLEMIKKGTTSFIDAGGVHMDSAAKVYLKAGLRGAITSSTMDAVNVPSAMRADADKCVSSLINLYDNYHGEGNGRLQVFFSLRSLISCSENLIKGVFNAANERNAVVEAHMNEYGNEINYFLENHQCRPLEYLERLGVLSERFISAHSIMLSENEIDIIKNNNIKVVHCPFSNCGKGIPNTPRLLQNGVSVALGSDGTAHGGMDLFQEMKIFRSIMNLHYGSRVMSPNIMRANDILKMATKGGSEALMMGESIGCLKEGYTADIVAIDLNQPHIFPTNNLVNTLVESVSGNDVKHMIVDGKLIMKNREVLTLDEEKIRYEEKVYIKNNSVMETSKCFL